MRYFEAAKIINFLDLVCVCLFFFNLFDTNVICCSYLIENYYGIRKFWLQFLLIFV